MSGVLSSLAALVVSYLIGTFPSALLVGRRAGVDPTRTGSGNPGTTNVLRTAGRGAAILTLVGDAGKGAVAAGLGWAVGGHTLGVACGLAAVLGHVAPLTRSFRGGKGVATAAGMLVVLFPLLAALGTGAFAAALALTRRVSVASLTATVVAMLAAPLLGAPAVEVVCLAACAVVVVVRHAENIRRLIRGEEDTLRT